ncbi:MAG: OsmC family protein, partial [Polyangiaceae bacterium]
SQVVSTDQSVEHGGTNSAPEPFDLFLASLATCAGLYVLGFCQTRNIPTEGLELVQHQRFDAETHRLTRIELELRLPATFPEAYRASVVRAAEGCKVKKLLASPPEVVVSAVASDP